MRLPREHLEQEFLPSGIQIFSIIQTSTYVTFVRGRSIAFFRFSKAINTYWKGAKDRALSICIKWWAVIVSSLSKEGSQGTIVKREM